MPKHDTGGPQPLNNCAVLSVFPNCKIMSTVSRIPDKKLKFKGWESNYPEKPKGV